MYGTTVYGQQAQRECGLVCSNVIIILSSDNVVVLAVILLLIVQKSFSHSNFWYIAVVPGLPRWHTW